MWEYLGKPDLEKQFSTDGQPGKMNFSFQRKDSCPNDRLRAGALHLWGVAQAQNLFLSLTFRSLMCFISSLPTYRTEARSTVTLFYLGNSNKTCLHMLRISLSYSWLHSPQVQKGNCERSAGNLFSNERRLSLVNSDCVPQLSEHPCVYYTARPERNLPSSARKVTSKSSVWCIRPSGIFLYCSLFA